MTQLNDSQFVMLKEYLELLHVMSEGFDYLYSNLQENAPPQVFDIFNDLLNAFAHLNSCHEQIAIIFVDEPSIQGELENCKHVIVKLSDWFNSTDNQEKKSIIGSQVIPAFEAWKYDMQVCLKPFIIH
ncbi:hypothetical protein KO561_15240 [Radiobacillus kanasensis]|uniref:hypothetical protein n=1 Tax=Radiobacillus kanasensis TaxID=2844358 RepID=UPI001E2D973A|nr:hypothetical protein [Radiobacillus kanasensis]UFT98538.1 hypothetical protein KO561_15240 [Radiobacillus kanasensis]